MDFVYHIGTQCTDEDRLIRSLLRNRGVLAREGVAVPAPGRYRPVLREMLIALRGAPATAEAQEALLDTIVEDEGTDRVVLSHEYFLGIPSRVLSPRGFHIAAGRKVAAIANLFPDSACEFHMALRNPATLIPALIAQTPGSSYASLVGDLDPRALRWETVIADIVSTVPHVRLVIWCNEDSPILWPEIMRRMADLPETVPLEGENDLMQAVLTPEGLQKMEAYLARHPPAGAVQRRRVAAAFLDKFAKADEVEVELPFPGWSESMVEEMSRSYDEDVAAIATYPGVEVMLP